MSDFTKEELIILRTYLQKEIPTPPDEHLNLLMKIILMIENYCEHKNITKDSALIDCCMDCDWAGFINE